jgi:IS1 family transposase
VIGQAFYLPSFLPSMTVIVEPKEPDPKHISTSFVERDNLSVRMGIRRYIRLTNAFSRKIENHSAAVALY